jgi:hypothetical protein
MCLRDLLSPEWRPKYLTEIELAREQIALAAYSRNFGEPRSHP